MSLEDEVTSLLKATGKLTASVDNKIGEINQSLVDAKQEFEGFKRNSDARYYSGETKSFTIDGDTDTYYPVVFKLSGAAPGVPESDVIGRIHNLHILKYVHNPAPGDGLFRFGVDVGSYGWGGYPTYIEPLMHNYSVKPFLGNYRYGGYGYFMVIWLRGGGRTYNYQSSWGVEPTIYMERTNLSAIQWGEDTGTSYPDWVEPEAVVNAGVVASGFRR